MGKINNLTKTKEIKKVISENENVMVDFWAPWCGPCRMIAPTIEDVANDDNGITVIKVNTDEAPDYAKDSNVRSIPTLHFYVKGKLVETTVGACNKETMLKPFKKEEK